MNHPDDMPAGLDPSSAQLAAETRALDLHCPYVTAADFMPVLTRMAKTRKRTRSPAR